MIYLEILLLVGIIAYGAKLGGIGVGLAGGVGMVCCVGLFGMKPGFIPVDVMLIIMTVVFAISVMQTCGGLAYMVKCAEKLLRKHPRYINILAPAVTFVLTTLGGTGYTAMSVLNVIQEVAKENGVRPSQPLTSAVIASQIACTASPISAATAALFVVVEKMNVTFAQVLLVIIPTSVFAAVLCALISSMQGVPLAEDPIFKERLAKGLVTLQSKEEKAKPASKEAKLSVGLFIAGVCVVVALLLFKPQIGHKLGSRDIIVMVMMFVAWLMYMFCGVKLTSIKEAPIFKSGYESLIVVLGIVWFSSTIINAHIPEVKESAVALLKDYPYLLAVVFFLVSAVLFSQGSTAALIVPVAASLGVDAATICGSFVACSALYITNVYPTTAFAISCDDTGSFMGRRWNGSMLINHPFFLPGCLSLAAAVPFGLFLAKFVM